MSDLDGTEVKGWIKHQRLVSLVLDKMPIEAVREYELAMKQVLIEAEAEKNFKPGDLVEVMDEGLAMLRNLIPEGKPNHHGKIAEIWDDGTILVEFPIENEGGGNHTQVAPYPPDKVRRRN